MVDEIAGETSFLMNKQCKIPIASDAVFAEREGPPPLNHAT